MSDEAAKADVLIIGAGFAGLTAARDLEALGYSVVMLEARDRVGGRIEATQIAGLTVDAGGMWVGPTQTSLLALAKEFNVETYPTYLEGKGITRLGANRYAPDGEAFENEIGLPRKIKLGLLLSKLEKAQKSIDVEAPWYGAKAAEFDQMTVAVWANKAVSDRTVRRILDFIVRSVFCCEPDELSFLYFLFYLKAAGGLEVLIQAGPGGAQNLLFHGGLHQIADRLLESLNAKVFLSTPIERVSQTLTGVTAVDQNGSKYVADRAIIATPPQNTLSMVFDPALPQARTELLKRQTMGACIKVWIAYDRPFWRETGLNGSLSDDNCAFAPVFDVTPSGSNIGLLAGFFDAHAATMWSDRTSDERRTKVLETLSEAFGPQALKPIDYFERDWTKERYSHGCYGAYMPPGALTRYGIELRRTAGLIDWAGTETATVWSGYVEGAIHSGKAAARRAVEQLRAVAKEKA
jgi:monoamine oxidase